MMPGNVFRLQLITALAGRRRPAMRIGVTLLLALPFVFVEMPPRAQASGLTMIIVFTALFGTAVGHARLRFDRRLARLALLPIARPILVLDLILSSVLARLAPVAGVVGLFVLVKGRSITPADILVLGAALCAGLVLLTVLGMAVAHLASSNAEVHLFGAVTAGLLAVASGLTPLPQRLRFLAWLEPANPVARLRHGFVALADGAQSANRAGIVASAALLAFVAAMAVQRWVSGADR